MTVTAKQCQRLASAEQAIISDCMTRLGIFGWMDGIRPINGATGGMAGKARTLLFGPKRGSDGFSKSTYALVEGLDPGDVLIFAAAGTLENLMGDNVATYAQQHGLAAIITDSMVRDAAGMNGLSMPVYSRGITARIPVASEPIAMDVPVVCGGAQVRPGDIVVGGLDGVLVLPSSRVGEVLEELPDVEKVEAELQALIANGARASEIEPVLKRKKAPRAKT